VILPEIDLTTDLDHDETHTLRRMTSALSDLTVKLLDSQSECELLRREASDCSDKYNVANHIVLSQQSTLREQFQASLQSVMDGMHALKQSVKTATEGAMKALEHVTVDCSRDVATDCMLDALACFVSGFDHDSGDNHSLKRLQETFSIVKMCHQKFKSAGENADAARAVEENKFISQRLHTLTQSLDGDYELVSRSPSQPSAVHAVSVIERTIAVRYPAPHIYTKIYTVHSYCFDAVNRF
jgi:hypothetical protein